MNTEDGKLKNQTWVKHNINLLAITLLMVLQIVSFLPNKVSAVELSNGVTITALNEKGEVVLPLKAVEFEKDETAFDILDKSANVESTFYEGLGEFIHSINGVSPSNQDYWWGFYVNGEYKSDEGASEYEVENGDSILFMVGDGKADPLNVRVSVKDLNDQVILDEEIEMFNGASAYDTLKIVGANSQKLVKASIDSTYFASLKAIGNVELGEYEYFASYMNGEYMLEGVSSYKIKDGDHLELVVESWAPTTPGEDENGEVPDKEPETPNDDTDEEEPPTNQNPDNNPITIEVVEQSIQSTKQYIQSNGILDDFSAIALKVAGENVPDEYINDVKERVITNDGSFRNVTEYEKMVLGLSAAGVDASNFLGYDLVEKIYSNERMTSQGNNGVIYALLAMDSGSYEVPSDAKWTRGKLVNYLLEQQLDGGSWSLFGEKGSVDITGMALAALSPYQDQEKVQLAIDEAVSWISSVQDENGGFSDDNNGGDASETTAQVIIGLASIGIDPADSRFVKQSGVNLVQHLLSYQQDNGGFAHIKGQEANDMATTQALLALSAYYNKGSIYQFSQPEKVVEPTQPDQTEVPESSNQEEQLEDEKATTPETSVQKEEVHVIGDTKEAKNGHQLPNTATPFFNLLTAGVVLLVVGSAGVIFTYRRKLN